MLFWISLVVLVICIVLMNVVMSVDFYKTEKQRKIWKIWRKVKEQLGYLCCFLVAFNIIVVTVCGMFMVANMITYPGQIATRTQTYEALMYKARTEAIRDEFGLLNEEYVSEIQNWNINLAKEQAYNHNIWTYNLYPDYVDDFELIDLESIEFKTK